MGNDEEVTDSDIVSDDSQGVEVVEDTKMTERRGNVYENKGSLWKTVVSAGNPNENKASYSIGAGM
jgi:hypothetical protein